MSSQTLKHLKYDGKEIQVESAVRDGTGKNIANTYATQSALSTGLAAKQATLTAGTGIDITNSTISITKPTSSALGGIKVGTGLSMASDGTVSVGEAGSVTWGNVTSKPFASVSSGSGGDFVISSNTLTINDAKFATKAHVADTYFTIAAATTLVNTTLPGTYQTKITSDNKLAYSLLSGAPTNLNAFTNGPGYITNAVSNLTNYYKKSETYTKTEVDNLLSQIDQFEFELVSELPTANETTYALKKIYLIPSANSKLENAKDEYLLIRTGTSGSYTYSWEQIGTTTPNLINYLAKFNDGDDDWGDGRANQQIAIYHVASGGGLASLELSKCYIKKTGTLTSETTNPGEGDYIHIPTEGIIYNAVNAKQNTLTTSNLVGSGIGVSISGGVITLTNKVTATDVTLDY